MSLSCISDVELLIQLHFHCTRENCSNIQAQRPFLDVQTAVQEVLTDIKPSFSCFDSVEESFIPLETQSQANKPVTPSEPEGRHSEGLITAKKWTPIATQRSRKPQNSASIQGNPALTSCTGKITIINPVVTSK
ncbi:hypothetical protein O181_132335, partial [Austropuccinia psidii MF-1]|nr:hypothetical protein [Austropuccinia psidii MF-1]